MTQRRIVVLGVGNILLKDEGIGVRVVEELNRLYDFPDYVKIVDGGTQGLWLLPTIQETDCLIVVDAVLGDGPPGTLYRLEKDDIPKGLRLKQSSHDNNLVEALNLCALVDRAPEHVVVVGVQPKEIVHFDLEMSEEVSRRKADLVQRVLDELSLLGVKPAKKRIESA
jgi:hydrogenase maturation protease